MIFTAVTAILASFCYFIASRKIAMKIRHFDQMNVERQRLQILTYSYAAVAFHLAAFSQTIWIETGFVFNFANALSMIGLVSSAVLLVLDRRHRAETLGIFLFPLSALTTLLPIALTEHTPMPLALGSHVLISIAAYSILGVAAAQAILYSIQEKRFRERKLSALMKALPPLQVMEKLMVMLVIVGFVLLTFALLSGVFFLEDIFAQHLVHKTFFAFLAWFVYATFILGHYRAGWRGQKAVRFVTWAYGLLIISFIGTEIVLHFVSK